MALDFQAASRRTVLTGAIFLGATLLGAGWGPASAQTTGAGTTGTGTQQDCVRIKDTRASLDCTINQSIQRTKDNNDRAAAAAKHSACTQGLMSWASEDEKKKASRIKIVQDIARDEGITDLANADTCALRDKAKDRELKLQGRVTPGIPPAAPVALQVK